MYVILPLSKSTSARQAANMDKIARITQVEKDIFKLPAKKIKEKGYKIRVKRSLAYISVGHFRGSTK